MDTFIRLKNKYHHNLSCSYQFPRTRTIESSSFLLRTCFRADNTLHPPWGRREFTHHRDSSRLQTQKGSVTKCKHFRPETTSGGSRKGGREGGGAQQGCVPLPFPFPLFPPSQNEIFLDVNLHSAVVVPDNGPQRNGMSSKGHQKQLVFVDQLLFNKLLDNNNK